MDSQNLNRNDQSKSFRKDEPSISLYQTNSTTDHDHHCHHSLLLSSAETSRNPFFHQACVFVPQHDELFTTSNLLQPTSSGSLPIILISRVKLRRRGSSHDDPSENHSSDVVAAEWQKLRPPGPMAMPAGGVAHAGGLVFCSQGTPAEGTGGLYHMPRGRPPELLVGSFYGRDFNSPCDVALAPDGALWFADPCRGFEMDFRGRPVLPCHVYRFDPEIGDLRVVEDRLGRPAGIAFSPDGSTVYISDTNASQAEAVQGLCR